jgi:hypothetical protein
MRLCVGVQVSAEMVRPLQLDFRFLSFRLNRYREPREVKRGSGMRGVVWCGAGWGSCHRACRRANRAREESDVTDSLHDGEVGECQCEHGRQFLTPEVTRNN